MKTIALVVPVYNEREQIVAFLSEVDKALLSLRKSHDWFVTFVDDGSLDGTADVVRDAYQAGWPVELIELSRNFGKEAALTAGFDYVEADAVVPMDVDLQHPPEVIVEMVAQWRAGADIVVAERLSRGKEGALKKIAAKAFYKLMDRLSEISMPRNVGDFRLLDKRVVVEIRRLRERNRYMKGLLSWPGFKVETVQYHQPGRVGGEAKQSYLKLVKLAMDGIIGFTAIPLRFWSVVGVLTSTCALAYMVWIILSTFIVGRDVPGYASLMSVILFVGGLQLISVGILGEYVSRIFVEVKARPIYVVNEYLAR